VWFVTDVVPPIVIPEQLKPSDGRFGCGPSKVRPEAVAALAATGADYLGTSHRQPAVRNMIGRLREGVASLFTLPHGWEVVLGNGGSTVFWDAATFGLIETRSQHLVFGEFSSKFATAVERSPHLEAPSVLEVAPGSAPEPVVDPEVDLYALTHNETSTGVAPPVQRPTEDATGGLVAVDATSAAGGIDWDPLDVDVYYFAPQKCLASDGGMFIAACSPAAVERIESLTRSDRWIPASLDLGVALDNSRKDQTYNTPALATVFLAVHQIEWLLDNGGMPFATGRTTESSTIMYSWAEATDWTMPFVSDPALRSPVVAAIDLDPSIDATLVAKVLRANGIIDTEAYRKLGRNQLRVGLFPAIEPADVASLTRCIEHVVERLGD
jgi:phosphoserine aminotransferase